MHRRFEFGRVGNSETLNFTAVADILVWDAELSRCWPAWGRGYAFMQAVVDPASHDCTLVFSNAAHSTRFLMTARAHAITCRADLITDEPSNALLRFHGVLCALKKSGFRPDCHCSQPNRYLSSWFLRETSSFVRLWLLGSAGRGYRWKDLA